MIYVVSLVEEELLKKAIKERGAKEAALSSTFIHILVCVPRDQRRSRYLESIICYTFG